MATTATVGCNGELVLPAEIQRTLGISPGSRVEMAVNGHHLEITPTERSIPADIQQLIDETCGMFAGGPSMAEELIEDRREEERRFNEKW